MTDTPSSSTPAEPEKTGAVSAKAPSTPSAHRVDGLALLMLRNGFYNNNMQKLTYVMIGQFIMIGILIFTTVKMMEFTDSRDYYFPVQTDNSLITERPLSEPVFTDEQITEWAEQAVTNTMTFGYYDHLIRLQESRRFFTTPGWASFTKALSDAKFLASIGAETDVVVKGARQVVSSRVRPGERARITKKGINGLRYTWVVELIIDVGMYERSRQVRFPWRVELIINRQPAMESRDGIGINQFVAFNQLAAKAPTKP